MSALQPQPTDKHASWAWSESRATEDDVVLRARERAAELDVPPVIEGTAALLTVLAATRAPAAVVETATPRDDESSPHPTAPRASRATSTSTNRIDLRMRRTIVSI